MLMTPEHIRLLLRDRNLQTVATGAGVSHGTVHALFSGKQLNQTADVLAKLTAYFEAQEDELRKKGYRVAQSRLLGDANNG